MALSNDLISQFVRVTNDNKKVKTEKTVNGTAKVHNGSTYVQLDGSDLLTPYSSTAEVKDGDRVTVTIKNHTATITGNLTSPAARIGSVEEINGKVKIVVDDLEATKGYVKNLEAENLKVNGKITANEAEIDKLKTNKLDASEANITFATIGDLNAASAEIDNLKTDKLDASEAIITFATIGNLDAAYAEIDNLQADYGEFKKASVDRLDAHDADINTLKANNADIEDLTATVGKIDTLMFGSASGNILQTDFANAVVAQLGDAQIKSAMIESVSAAKITAGDIITNNVQVKSEDGSLLISDETIQISDDNRVRVQIGKDASDDYSINIWDAEGNLMFSEGGITDSAIKNAIIRDDMVAENANISGSKLDIDSLFTEMNKDGTQTLKSTKVYLDEEGQTLDVSFKALTGEVSSQGTDISVIKGQITSKIWEQDINAATGELNTKYSTLEQTVEGLTVEVGDSAKTATNFLKYDGVNGLVVGDMTGDALGKNVLIDTNSVDIRNGNDVLASFGEKTIDLGIAADNSTINLCGKKGIIKLGEFSSGAEYLLFKSTNDMRLEAENGLSLWALRQPAKAYDSATFTMKYITDGVTSESLYPYASIITNSGTTLSDRLQGVLEVSPDGARLSCDNGSINIIADTAEEYTYADIHLMANSGRFLVSSENVDIQDYYVNLPSTLTIGSRKYGVNKVLWTGAYYMQASQTAVLTDLISNQPHGIVLLFSPYTPTGSVVHDTHVSYHFIPKYVLDFTVTTHNFTMSGINNNGDLFAEKILWIRDSEISGTDTNVQTYTKKGVTFNNNGFVLRAVIGV